MSYCQEANPTIRGSSTGMVDFQAYRDSEDEYSDSPHSAGARDHDHFRHVPVSPTSPQGSVFRERPGYDREESRHGFRYGNDSEGVAHQTYGLNERLRNIDEGRRITSVSPGPEVPPESDEEISEPVQEVINSSLHVLRNVAPGVFEDLNISSTRMTCRWAGCGTEIADNELSIIQHFRNHHPGAFLPQVSGAPVVCLWQDDADTDISVVCNQAMLPSSLVRHLLATKHIDVAGRHKGEWLCGFCGKHFRRRTSIVRHVADTHNKCPACFCGEVFLSHEFLKQHHKEAHPHDSMSTGKQPSRALQGQEPSQPPINHFHTYQPAQQLLPTVEADDKTRQIPRFREDSEDIESEDEL